MPGPEPRARGGRRHLIGLAPFIPVLVLVAAMGAADVVARDPQLPEGASRLRPASDEMNRAAGLERSDRCDGLWTSRRAARADAVAQNPGCTHGLDVFEPGTDEPGTAQAVLAAGKVPPFPTPPGIPCYTSGPYVKVLYVYDRNGSSKLDKRGPVIREIIAHSDKLIDDSAKRYDGRRHARWLMDGSCKLRIVAVGADLGLDILSLRANLVSRGLLSTGEKGLAFTEADIGGCSGVGEVYPNDSASSSNPNNSGGMLALVYAGCWTAPENVMIGTLVATHELFHTLGAVQRSAPNSTSPGMHCTDEWDTMCYDDGAGHRMRVVCAKREPEWLDCGGNDYFNPNPKAGSYLATKWNTARNRFLASGSPAKWDRLARPTATITGPGSTSIAGVTTFTASAAAPTGTTIAEVAWTVNGTYVQSDTTAPYTLRLDTFPENGGYSNGQPLKVVAWAVDSAYRWGGSAEKAVKVANPKVRLTSPAMWEVASGDMPWSVEASAAGGRTVAKVELLVDGAVVATDTTAPYGGTWNVRDLWFWEASVEARVTDSAGTVRTTPSRSIGIGAPTVELIRPRAYGTVYPDDATLLAADATGSAGASIARVEFLVNGTVVGQDTTSPFTFLLDTSGRADGATLDVTARAVDSRGHVSEPDGPGTLIVDHSTAAATLTQPASGATVSGTVTVAATTTAPAADVWYASFQVNGDEVASDYEAPWSGTWDSRWTQDGPAVLTVQFWVDDPSGGGYVESVGTPVTVANGGGGGSASLVKPASGAVVSGTVTLETTIDLDSGVDLYSVEFYGADEFLGWADSDATPYVLRWNSTGVHDGTIPIRAVISTSDGQIVTKERAVTVRNLTAKISKPVAGAVVKGKVTVTAATTSDLETKVERVELLVNGVTVAKDYVKPWSFSWNTTKLANGSHKLKVVAITRDGRSAASGSRTVTVRN